MAKFWEQPWYQQYLKDKRQKREQNKIKVAAVQTLNSRNLSNPQTGFMPEYLRRLTPGMPYSAKKEQAKVWVRKVAEGARRAAPAAPSVRQMPDRVVDRTSIAPRVNPQARMGTVTPGMAPRVPAAPPVPKPSIKYKVAPGTQPGQEVYVNLDKDQELVYLTSQPTDIKLFNMDGQPVFVGRDDDGNWALSQEQIADGLNFDRLMPATYTPDLPENLNYTKTVTDLLKPITVDGMIQRGQQLFYDSITHQITSRPTQVQFFFAPDGNELTDQRFSLGEDGQWHENLPATYNERTDQFLKEMVTSHVEQYDADQLLERMNYPARPEQIASGNGQVSMEQIRAQGKVDVVTGPQDIVSVDLGGGDIAALTQQTSTLSLPFNISSSLKNSKVINTLAGIFLGPMGWFSPEYRQKKIDEVVNAAGWGWIALSESSNVIKQGPMSSEKYMVRQSGFPDMVAADLANILSLGFGFVLSSGASIAAPLVSIWEKDTAQSLRDYAAQMRAKMQDKNAIMVEQTAEAVYRFMEQPAFGWSPTQREVESTAFSEEQYRRALGLNPNLPAPDERTAVGQVYSLQRYVDNLNRSVDQGLDLMVQGIGLHQSGLKDEALDFYTEGYYKYFTQGLDWAAINNAITGKDTNLQQKGVEALLNSDVPVTQDELKFLWRFMVYGQVENSWTMNRLGTKGGDAGPYTSLEPGVNYEFMRHLAERRFAIGRDLTLDEIYEESQTWLTNWFANPDTLQDRRAFLQGRVRSIHDRAQSIKEAAVAYSKLGDQAKADEFMRAARNLLVDVYDIDRKSNTLDAYSAYTWDAFPERKQKFYEDLAEAELQLGRPLTRQEIIDISYHSIELVYEMGGEAVFDVLNVLEFAKVGKVAINAAQVAGMKALIKVPGGTALIDDVLKAGEEISNLALIRYFKGRALLSQAHKQAQTASNLVSDVLRSNPRSKEELVKIVRQLGDGIKAAQGAATRDAAWQTLKNATKQLPKTVADRALRDAMEMLVDTINPDTWGDEIARVWDEQVEFMTERARVSVERQYKRAPVLADVADLNVVKANKIRAEVLRNMTNWAGRNRLAVEFGDGFRRAFSEKNRAWTDSVILSDTWYAKLGGAGKELTPIRAQLRNTIDLLYAINQKFMKAWVWATLARRPSWMLYNFMDNTFRFFVSGAGDLGDIAFLLRETAGREIAESIGVPAGVTTDMQAASFRVLTGTMETGLGELKHIAGIDELRQNPLGFLQHYMVNYQALTQGRGPSMHLYSIWRAFPMSVKSLASTIEYGSRIRMYYKLFSKNVVKLNRTVLANLIDGIAPTPGSLPVLSLKQRLLATGMNEADAERWVKYVKDMWWATGNNGSKFEYALQRLSQTGRYRNESMFLPQALRKADWFDEELHRPLIINVLDELQKFVTEQSKTGLARLTKAQTDQFFDRVIATLDAEIEARTSVVWGQQYQMLRGFDEVEGYKNYKSGPYYPKMEADSGEKITESGHKALQDIPGGTTTLSNKQRKSISKAIKDNGVVLSGDTDKDLLKGVEILRERAGKSAKAPLTDAQAKAIEDGLKNITPADVPTNADEIMAADKLIDENVPTSGRLAAGSRQSAAADEFRKLSTPVTFENNPAYRLLSRTDKDLISAHARHLEEQMRNFSGRVRAYWIYSNPGPILFDSSGRRILRSRTTGAAWDQYDLLATRLYDNQVGQFGELVDAINTGTFHPGVTYTVKDMLDKAGINLNFDNQGRLVRMRMNNPATGEWEEITDPAALNRFKKITGVTDQKVYDESIQLMDANRLAPKEERVMRIAAKLIPSPHKSYDEMVQSTPRLALAITEKRLRDANLILAGEFKYPMFYEKAGSLIPTDDRLMKRILSETKEAAYKTLDDVPPDVVHQVLDRWAQTSHGYEMGKMVKTLEKDMVEVLMRQFGWKEAGAREFFKLYDKTITNLANFTSNVTGKTVTREEMWTQVFYGFYKMEPGADGNLLRFVDGRIGFQSHMGDFVERVMTDQVRGAELLANLRLHGFSDAELKWNGMYKWLQDNKTANISQASMRKFLAERERFISGEVGRGGVWEVTLRNSDAAELAKVHGSLIIDPTDNLYSLRLDKIDGNLDEHSLKRLQRWARDNDADKLVMPDGVVHDLRKIADFKPPLRPMTEGYLGSVDWVKNALDKQTALIKSFSGANITTASHEMFHAVYPHLPEEARAVLEEWADESLLALKDSRSPAYKQFAKLSPEIARNEIITKAWEKYLITEVAPNAEIGNIFKAIRNYLVNTYRTMKDYFAGVYLTPEVRQVFDQMIGDGWKKQKAAATPKPKGPGPKASKAAPKPVAQVEEEVKAAVRKSKEMVTSKPVVQKDTVTKVAEFIEASDFDVAEGRWLTNGTFYDAERAKLFFEGSTARDVVDHELNDLRNTLQINPSVDLSTIRAENTGWVAFDKKVAKKYNRTMGRSAKNIPMHKLEYFRVLAVDENGTALVEFSHTKPAGLDELTQFQNIHSNQSLAEIVNNGDPSEFRMALLDLLDVVGRDDLEHLIDEMTPIINGIEAKFIQSDWKLAPKHLTDIEIEAFSTLADLFIDSERWFNLPSKPVQRFVSKFKDHTGKLQEIAPVRILNIRAIQNTDQLANLFLDVAQAVYKPLNDGKLPRIQRVTDKLVEVFERRGFDARVMVDNLRSDVVHDALIAGWKLEKNLPPGTPEFVKFAGNSQVRDADGLLTVVYHGSISDFTEFRVALDLGHHFGTPYAALDRVRWREGRVVHGYWLNITNPVTLTDEGGWGAASVVHLLRKKDILTEEQVTEWLTELNEIKNVTFANVIGLDSSGPISLQQANEVMYNIQQQYPILKEHGNFDAEDLMETWNLGVSGGIHRVPVENRVTQSYVVAKLHRDYGYDGVKYTNAFENAGSTSWIAFYKNQIKRVDNPGTFNPRSNDTMFQAINKRLDSYEQRAGTSKLALENWTNTLTGMLDNPHQLFLDADTGFMNANALVSDPKALSKPTTAYIIGNGFDYIHREMGEAASRDYIRALATALRTSGLDEGDIFHMGGSRFVVQMTDPRQLDNVLRAIDEAPTVRVSDMTGEMWDVDLNISHSGVGPNTQIPEQFDLAQAASERTRAEAYKQWAAEAGDTAQFRTNWEALDNADKVGAEIQTHPYIQPADTTFKSATDLDGRLLFQKDGSNGYFAKAKQPDPQPEIDLAWRTFVQSPIFEHGSSRVSLVQLWNTLFGSEELMLKAGPKGFANITSKLAQEYLDRGMLNQAEVMRSLSALADNFQEYISGSVIKLDALVPPPLPMWNNNPVVRQWVSNLYGVGSELEGSKNLMRLWKEEFGTNIEESPLAMLDIGDEASKVLDDMAQTGAQQKSEINDIANYGGRIGDELILSADGAVTATNFNMIDYTDFSQFDQFMKDFVPFWMYPAKSIPFWLKSMVQHPELVMFYNKYMRWSEMAAISYDAVNSQGEPLPSLKGYMPLLPGLWFNPLAPFMFRYVFPRVENIPDEREELTPVQSIAKFLLDDAPIYGINISPAMSAALQTLYEPYYPKTNLAYEFGRTLIPLEFIPPFMERWLLNTVRKIAKGNVNIPERFQEEVSWKDYLIEREILTNALLRMKDAPNLEAKEAIAKEAYAVITRDESLIGPREEDPIWLEARSKIENGEYYRRMAGMFTGIYTKEFSSGQAELNLIRDEVNSLRNAVNDEVSAVLFYPYMTQADIYDAYTTRKYKTPEGWIWNAYQMTRYVTDEEGRPMEGQLRRNEIARQAIIDNQTQLRYAALKAAADLKDQRLLDIPVGADDLRDKIMQEYYETLAKINDPEGLYPLAQKEYVMGYKPIEKIQEHITSEWWRQLRSTYPHRSQTETWTQYELRVEAWKDNLPNQAAKMLPIFQTNFNWNIFQGEIETEERMAEVPNILKGLLATSNRDGYEQYVLQNDGVVEAIWNAYEDMYLKPYYDAIKNKSGNERRLAELEFFKSHPLEPGANEIQQWITGKYGPDKFGSKLIRDTINGLTFASLDEINKLSDKPKDPDRTRVFDILAWAGPQQSENYKALVAAYIELGGYESDFDVWWGTGGDVNNYADVERYYEFVNWVKQAGAKLGAEAPNEQQLRDMLSAEADQAEFKTSVLAELGGNFYTTLALYMNMSSSERKEWRNLNKDLYKKINRYYEMRDEWAKDHELWASYYYPAFTLQNEPAGGVSTSSGGGQGGSKGYSTFEQEERAWWIPMGKRSSLDVMALFIPGKLGSAGVTDKPWWPDSLLKLLDPLAVEEVQAATNGQAPLSNATVTYLGKVAKKYPEYTQLIRSNIKKIKRTYPVRELAKDMRKFV